MSDFITASYMHELMPTEQASQTAGGNWMDSITSLPGTIGQGIIASGVELLNIPTALASIPVNLLGGDMDSRWVYTEEVMGKLDNALGTNFEDYYYAHKEAVDAWGFVGSSLAPGTVAAKIVRAGLGNIAKMESTSVFANAIGRFESIGPKAIEAAKLEIAQGTPFSYLSSNALKAYAAGAGQGVIDALAFNTAATLALHSSPYLEGKSFTNLTYDIFTDSFLFGAPLGGLFDIAGKQVGILGYKKAIKPYSDNIANVFATAAAPFDRYGDVYRAGAKILGAQGKAITITDGTEAMAHVMDLNLIRQRSTELKALLDSGQLSADSAALLKAEMDSFTVRRAEAIANIESKAADAIRRLFKDVEDVADVNSIIKQILDPKMTFDNAASLLADAKRFTRLGADQLMDMNPTNTLKVYQLGGKNASKVDFTLQDLPGGQARMVKLTNPLRVADEAELRKALGLADNVDIKSNAMDDALRAAGHDSYVLGDLVHVVPRYNKKGKLMPVPGSTTRRAIVDIIEGKVVNKASKATAWDIDRRTFGDTIQELGDSPEISAALDPIQNSALYRQAIQMFDNGSLKKAENIPQLEVLLFNKPKQDSYLFRGVPLSREGAEDLIRQEKFKVAEGMAQEGYNTEQISASIMIPEETLLSPDSTSGISTVLRRELQAPRYISANYGNSRSMSKFEIEGKLEIAAKTKMIEEHADAVVKSLNPEIAAMPPIEITKYSENFTAKLFSYFDASFSSEFEMAVQANARVYTKATQKAMEERVTPIKTKIEAIKAMGVGSAEHTEFVLFNAWNKQARNRGSGNTVAIEVNGRLNLMEGAAFRGTKEKMIQEIMEENPLISLGEAADSITGADVLQRYIANNPGIATKKVGEAGTVFTVHTSAVQDLLTTHIRADYRALEGKNKIRALHGESLVRVERTSGAYTFYDPPPDMRNAKHVLVIAGDDMHQNPLYRGQRYVYVGRDAQDIARAEAWATSEGLKAYTKGQTQEFYRQLGIYEGSMTFNNGIIKDTMESRGKLTSYLGAAESFEDTSTRWLDWHLRDEQSLQRAVIGVKEHKAVSALRNIDLHQRRLEDSKKGTVNRISRLLQSEATRTTGAERILNTIFNTQSPGIVNAFTKSIDDFGAQFFTKARDIFTSFKLQDFDKPTGPQAKALKQWLDNIGVEQYVSKDIVEAIGVKNYDSPAYANFIRTSNMALVMGQLRLDAINSLVNVIGMPIIGSSTVELAIRATIGKLEQAGRKLDADNIRKVLYQKEGTFGYMPATYVKMAKQSISRMDLKAKDNPVIGSLAEGDETLGQFFLRNNITYNPADVAMLDLAEQTIKGLKSGNTKASFYAEKIQNALQKVTKPTDLIESRIQFISADAALQIAEAGRLDAKDAIRLMHTMVSKLQGNFTASMKPQIFQGITGSALGLFQSYQARLIHRLSDIITDGNKRMLAEAAVLQTSIFGGRSLPYFDALNNALVAESNADNQDIYSSIYGGMDRNIANALVYGLPSALLGLNMSTRGNTTPRYPSTIVDIPAVGMWYKQLSQLKDAFGQAMGGGDISQLFNHSLQHNVFSRPLQQLAILGSGYSTTNNNKLAIDIDSAKLVNENNWLPFNIANMMRVTGSRPIDEAVMLDTLYRWQGFELADREKREELGKSVSSKLLGQGTINADDLIEFQDRYLQSGGTAKGFERFIKSQATNSSLMGIDRLLRTVKNDDRSKHLQIMLGIPADYKVPTMEELSPKDYFEEE
jgi:hypothetical protein